MPIPALRATLVAAALLAAPLAAHAQGSPRSRALAHQIVEAVGGQKTIEATMLRTSESLSAALPTPPGADGAQMRERVLGLVQKESVRYLPQVLAATEDVYVETFTEAQLQDILAFYQTPTGRALAEKLPEIGERTGRRIAPVMRLMQRDLAYDLCDLQKCTAEQRAQLAKVFGPPAG
jgi:uncharacterized protein